MGAVPPVKGGDRLKQAGWNLGLLLPAACVHHCMAPPTIKWLGGGISMMQNVQGKDKSVLIQTLIFSHPATLVGAHTLLLHF